MAWCPGCSQTFLSNLPAKRVRRPPRDRSQAPTGEMVSSSEDSDMDVLSHPYDAALPGFSVESDLAAQVAALQEQLQAVLVRNNELNKHVFWAE